MFFCSSFIQVIQLGLVSSTFNWWLTNSPSSLYNTRLGGSLVLVFLDSRQHLIWLPVRMKIVVLMGLIVGFFQQMELYQRMMELIVGLFQPMEPYQRMRVMSLD
uniref:Uncharacterized protein n=1 Tax=Cacopsylla melanoneura TaxID=428564 RepID=A0A8D8ZE15_9HEMI